MIGRTAGASAGHPLTTAAAIEILQKGGNAFDAGVAALLVGGVVEQDLYSLGGEALVLVYPTSARKVSKDGASGFGFTSDMHKFCLIPPPHSEAPEGLRQSFDPSRASL